MGSYFKPLSPSAQTAYAQAFDHAMAASVHRHVADLTGTFAKKTVSGKEYWYFQYRDINSKVMQVYLGRRNERLDKLIAAKQADDGKPSDAITKQVRAALALGNRRIAKAQYRVIRRLDEYGFFKAGGVLVGTHAFACLGNMLGVEWVQRRKTRDMDFADAGNHLSVGLPSDVKFDVHDALTSLETGFLPSRRLDGLVGGSYVRSQDLDFRIDFLTAVGRKNADLVNFPNLNVAMVPLKFMEYLLKDVRQAASLSDDGAVLVNLPSPSRYALHKLIAASEPGSAVSTKILKDLNQAAALISFLSEHFPFELADAWIDLESRDKGWRSRFNNGLQLLVKEDPEMAPVIARCRDIVADRKERIEDESNEASGE